MDGKERWPGNVYVERLWRSLKQEEVYWHAYETVSEAKKGIADYLRYFNEERPHQGLDNRTPDDSTLKNAGKTVQFSRTISLRQRAVAANGGESYLRLERRTMGSACAF